MPHMRTLSALSMEMVLKKTRGPNFIRGLMFMKSAGLSPRRVTILYTLDRKYILQFSLKGSSRPFSARFNSFYKLLRALQDYKYWAIRMLEFINICFGVNFTPVIKNALENLGNLELVILRNCTYPGLECSKDAREFLKSINREGRTAVCEYGDDRLKYRINLKKGGVLPRIVIPHTVPQNIYEEELDDVTLRSGLERDADDVKQLRSVAGVKRSFSNNLEGMDYSDEDESDYETDAESEVEQNSADDGDEDDEMSMFSDEEGLEESNVQDNDEIGCR